MKKSNRFWLLSATLTCVFSFAGVLIGQDVSSPATNAATAEAPESNTNTAPSASDASSNAPAALRRGPIVTWGDAEVKKGEEGELLVTICGNARVNGEMHGPVVAIFGNVDLMGGTQPEAVAILGNLKLGPGSHVYNSAVAILGDVTIEPGANVDNQVVAVGGRVDAREGVKIDGQIQSLDLPKSVKTWFVQCVLKLRPLAPQVGWIWLIAGAFFLLYFFITVLFPHPVQACVAELGNRPTTTFLYGLLTKALAPVVLSILAVTVAGALVVPFVVAALLLGAIIGKAALLQRIGLRFARLAPGSFLQNPVPSLVIGGLFITLLYMVPVLGLLTFMVVSIWGLGGAVAAALGGMRREMPPKPLTAPSAPAPAGSALSDASAAITPGTCSVPMALPEMMNYPRARFLERMAAGILDMILVSIVCRMGHIHGLWPLVALAYFVAMWRWKSTSIGGIILGLKVVRLDGQPLTFTVALVRALAAAFSIIVLFLGFLWIIWDRDKQGWHDQITGTVVLRLPRGTPLVCF